MSPLFLDKYLCKLRWSSLKSFSRNSTRSHRRRHFRQIFHDNFRLEAASDDICGVAVELVGLDVPVNLVILWVKPFSIYSRRPPCDGRRTAPADGPCNNWVFCLKTDANILNKKPVNWWGRQNAAPLKVDPKPSEAHFGPFSRTSINTYRRTWCHIRVALSWVGRDAVYNF